jgi:hypothetical protein
MLYQNPAIRSRVEVHLVAEAKGGPSKLLLSFLLVLATLYCFAKFHPFAIVDIRASGFKVGAS